MFHSIILKPQFYDIESFWFCSSSVRRCPFLSCEISFRQHVHIKQNGTKINSTLLIVRIGKDLLLKSTIQTSGASSFLFSLDRRQALTGLALGNVKHCGLRLLLLVPDLWLASLSISLPGKGFFSTTWKIFCSYCWHFKGHSTKANISLSYFF